MRRATRGWRGVLLAVASLGLSCGPGRGVTDALSGPARGFPDAARARPPYCDTTKNCAVLPVEGEPRNLLPDGLGGLWYLGWRRATNESSLVHVDATGRTALVEPLGVSAVSLALSAQGAVALAGDSPGTVTVAGHSDGVAAPFTSGWVGVRNADGTGWLRYFGSITNNSSALRSLSAGAVAWLPDGRLAVAATCSGAWATPLPLDCSGTGGDLVLLTFAADGSTVDRRVLGAGPTATQLLQAPDGALYLQTFTGGNGAPKLGDIVVSMAAAQVARVDGSVRWVREVTGQGGPYVLPGGMTLARDGRLWSAINSASLTGGQSATLGVDGEARQPVGALGDGALLITTADGVVEFFRAAVTQAGSGVTGFAEVNGGEMVALWIVNGADPKFRGGAWGPHPLPDNQLVEMLPSGQWRGLRKVGVSVAGTALRGDAAGRVFSLGVVLPEQPTAVLLRIDAPR